MTSHVSNLFTPRRMITLALGFPGMACGSRLPEDTFAPAPLSKAAIPAPLSQPPALAPAPIFALAPVRNTTWQWRDVSGAVCANGDPTGYAVNLQPDAQRLMIYLEGGGDCDSFATCTVLNSASYINGGYSSNTFFTNSNELPYLLKFGPTDRNNSANPMQGYSYAYFPYCTGDLHGGNNVVRYNPNPHNYHHVGAVNTQLFLQDLNMTLSGIDYVLLAGSSAGGFGAVLNYERTVQAFPKAHVDLLDDSGIAFNNTSVPSSWKLQYPTYCADGCNQDFSQLLLHTAAAYPNTSIGLTAYTYDDTLPEFLGISPSTYHDRLEALAPSMAATPNLRFFFQDDVGHENLRNLNQTSDGVSLSSFVNGLVTRAANWTNEPAR
jgi:hypothetical protein